MLKVNSIAVAQNISAASGNFCQLTCPLPAATGVGDVEGVDLFDSGYYVIQTGAGVSAGAVTLAMWVWPGVWVPVTTPNSSSGTAFNLISTLGANATYMGSLGVTGSVFFPCPGLRFVLSGLAGGNITNMALMLTRR